ncbi:MAG: MBL fold metallo-hydrolase [Thermoleophilaceae bacterium]|nr:MBL fold metallo-hydrolase [Thermoleophilaceae bacterium]
MEVRIHRGACQVAGGTVIEVAAEDKRLVLDVGMPMRRTPHRDLLPDVPGLWADGDSSLLGVLVTHSHPDHVGLADLVAPSVPVHMGAAAERIRDAASFFWPGARSFELAEGFVHRKPLELGPFTVTPMEVDHCAYDAHALLIEAGGRSLLYTGDIRAHGRRGETLRELAREAHGVDAVLMEGTSLGPWNAGRSSHSEQDVEEQCVDTFTHTRGAVLAFFATQNLDRLVTLYRAARRSGRTFVMDLYTATVAKAAGDPRIPTADSPGVAVYLPRSQKMRVVETEEFWRTEDVRENRIYPDQLAARADGLVITCRARMLSELDRVDCLEGAGAVWSMWPGYLDNDHGEEFRQDLRRLGIPWVVHHASGHAYPEDLERFAQALGARRVVPVHTSAPEAFAEHFAHVEQRADGEWWSV